MDIRAAFGKVLKQARQEKNFSQETLAFEMDVERSYISKLEIGMYQPRLSTILLAAKVLDIRASVLVDRVEELMEQE